MSKIVIPKHSADIDEMNAVLKIHYDAKGWVKSADYNRQLKKLIGADQYSSSYPKKAQVPAYFGFLESNVSSGGKIIERRITESGREMYEAILSDDRITRQRLLLEAMEKIIFGRNNAGCTSSNSDIEAPAIVVKCILDTGYCTSSEYAYLVWALNDKCKKYYESLENIIKARSTGGIIIDAEASGYKDWKPVLAMLRWGFLMESEDTSPKVLLHSEVIERYFDRLQKLKIYNIDKQGEIDEVDFDDISIGNGTDTSYKPFKIDDKNIPRISDGHFLQACSDIEQQMIFEGDQVLLVDRQITRLAAYYSYFIKELAKDGDNYDVSLQRQFAINRSKEGELVTALKAEDELASSLRIQDAVKAIISYDDFEAHLKINDRSNKDVLPAYLVLRALLILNHLTNKEQDYLVYSMINDKAAYTDIICTITSSREKEDLQYSVEMQGCSKLPAIQKFKDKGIFEPYLHDGKQGIQINPIIRAKYTEILCRLSFYAVDIERQHLVNAADETYRLPKVIKALLVMKSEEMCKQNGSIYVSKKQTREQKIVQGDYIVFVDAGIEKVQEMYVFQVINCEKKLDGYNIKFERRHVINPVKEDDIIRMIKEA